MRIVERYKVSPSCWLYQSLSKLLSVIKADIGVNAFKCGHIAELIKTISQTP